MGWETYSEQQHTRLLFYLNFFVYIYKLLTKGAFFCNSVMSFLSFNVQFYCFFKKEGGEEKRIPSLYSRFTIWDGSKVTVYDLQHAYIFK